MDWLVISIKQNLGCLVIGHELIVIFCFHPLLYIRSAPYPDFPPESPDPLPLPPDTETVTQAPSPETEPSTGVTQRDAINNKLAMIQNFVVKWDINEKSFYAKA